MIQRRLHPKVRGARQNAFCERQDALYVEFFHRFGVVVDLGERQFLAQFVALPFIARQVDRLRVEKGFVEPVQLLLNRFGLTLSVGRSSAAVQSFAGSASTLCVCGIRAA